MRKMHRQERWYSLQGRVFPKPFSVTTSGVTPCLGSITAQKSILLHRRIPCFLKI